MQPNGESLLSKICIPAIAIAPVLMLASNLIGFLGGALGRTGTVLVPIAALVVLAGIAFPVARITSIGPAVVAADAVLVFAFGTIALRPRGHLFSV